MDAIFTVLGWISIPLTLVSIAVVIRRWRQDQQVRAGPLLLAVGMSAGGATLYLLALPVPVPVTAWAAGGATLVAGFAWSQAEDLRLVDGTVATSTTAWSVGVWALTFATSQVIALTAADSLDVGLIALLAGTGLTVGERAGLLMRRASLLGTGTPGLGPATAVLFLVLGLVGFAAGSARADDPVWTVGQVGQEKVANLHVRVNGSGITYRGDSIELTFDNATGREQTVRVPIGTRFVPENSGVQTMLAAGNEVITVPPGSSSVVIRAFCGEKDDAAPGTADVFTVEEPDTDAETTRTLERADELFRNNEVTDEQIQQALWSQTDGLDVSGNRDVERILDPGTPSDREVGTAGALAAAPSTAVAAAPLVAGDRRRRSGYRGPAKPTRPAGAPPDEDPDIAEFEKLFEEDDDTTNRGRNGDASNGGASGADSETETDTDTDTDTDNDTDTEKPAATPPAPVTPPDGRTTGPSEVGSAPPATTTPPWSERPPLTPAEVLAELEQARDQLREAKELLENLPKEIRNEARRQLEAQQRALRAARDQLRREWKQLRPQMRARLHQLGRELASDAGTFTIGNMTVRPDPAGSGLIGTTADGRTTFHADRDGAALEHTSPSGRQTHTYVLSDEGVGFEQVTKTPTGQRVVRGMIDRRNRTIGYSDPNVSVLVDADGHGFVTGPVRGHLGGLRFRGTAGVERLALPTGRDDVNVTFDLTLDKNITLQRHHDELQVRVPVRQWRF